MSDRHTNVLIFQLLKYLNSRRDSEVSYLEIKEALNIEKKEFDLLKKHVANNARVEIKEESFKFRPLFKFSNLQELETALRNKFPEGIKYEDIRNEAPFIDAGTNSQISPTIIMLEIKNNCHMLFYNALSIPDADKDLKDLWNNIVIPDKYNQGLY